MNFLLLGDFSCSGLGPCVYHHHDSFLKHLVLPVPSTGGTDLKATDHAARELESTEKGHPTGVAEKASWRRCDQEAQKEPARGRRREREADVEMEPGPLGEAGRRREHQ